MRRRPEIAKDLPPPEDVTAEALRDAVEEARQWRDQVERLTRRMDAEDVIGRSVRSGRRYCAGEADLLPLSAFADPTELCVQCGRRRDDHPMRHKFKTAKEPT